MTNQQKIDLLEILQQIIQAANEPEIYALALHAAQYIEDL